MNRTNTRVTHIGQDYASVKIIISTSKGQHIIEHVEVPKYVGEALHESGMTEYEA